MKKTHTVLVQLWNQWLGPILTDLLKLEIVSPNLVTLPSFGGITSKLHVFLNLDGLYRTCSVWPKTSDFLLYKNKNNDIIMNCNTSLYSASCLQLWSAHGLQPYPGPGQTSLLATSMKRVKTYFEIFFRKLFEQKKDDLLVVGLKFNLVNLVSDLLITPMIEWSASLLAARELLGGRTVTSQE